MGRGGEGKAEKKTINREKNISVRLFIRLSNIT